MKRKYQRGDKSVIDQLLKLGGWTLEKIAADIYGITSQELLQKIKDGEK